MVVKFSNDKGFLEVKSFQKAIDCLSHSVHLGKIHGYNLKARIVKFGNHDLLGVYYHRVNFWNKYELEFSNTFSVGSDSIRLDEDCGTMIIEGYVSGREEYFESDPITADSLDVEGVSVEVSDSYVLANMKDEVLDMVKKLKLYNLK